MLAAALITLFGLALRLLYVFTAQVEHPIYGDGLQYMVYAWNLWTHGVFSSSPAGSQIVVPDGYREPGYPIFLAAAFGLAGGDVDAAVRYAWLGQVLLGAICVPMTIGLARQWLDWNLSLLAGLLVACWPHMITFCGALMTETLFGFFILLGLLLLCTGERMVKRRFVAAAGLAFGGAYLVKGIVLMFPFLAALALARRGKVMLAAVLMTTTAIAPIAWTWRNAQLPSAQAQTELNQAVDAFVWGSSPVYLVAFDSRWVSAEAKQIVERERQEAAQMHEDPGAGLDMIAERMGQDPLAYVSWYLLEKPFLLWDWSIVIGNGDIYYPPTRSSPFERIAALKVIKIVLQWLNPLLFALALLSMARFLWRFFVGRDEASFTPIALAIFMFYMTVMHAILTAEPRYSIPYRPVEIVLAVGTLALLAGFVQRRRGEPRGITRDGLVGSQERLP
jgi:4-amino-4-deoxy-L-arabinose transferase-like glycosyltransferase